MSFLKTAVWFLLAGLFLGSISHLTTDKLGGGERVLYRPRDSSPVLLLFNDEVFTKTYENIRSNLRPLCALLLTDTKQIFTKLRHKSINTNF